MSHAITPILDAETITAAMWRARIEGCPPDGRRCDAWPNTPEGALTSLDADGWCTLGMVEDAGCRKCKRSRPYVAWHVHFHVDTGEVRLERDMGEAQYWFGGT